MKTINKVIFIIIFFVTVSCILYNKNKSIVRTLKIMILGDKALNEVEKSFKVKFIPEKFLTFSTINDSDFRPTWGFRPSHAVPCYPMPVIADVDKDGSPEVFIGSYSKEITVINGRNKSLQWNWSLPFGVLGGRSIFLQDINNDGKEELILGTSTSLPVRIYAINTNPILKQKERLIWKTDVRGDFIEGGINVFQGKGDTGVIILASTRDAPYSRGSFNLINNVG